MTVVRYFDNGKPWQAKRIDKPKWSEIKASIKQMDNHYFPIIQLSYLPLGVGETGFDDEESLNIVGGSGKYALFQFMGEWQYENNTGNDKEVRLWESGQGYFCQEKNIIDDIKRLLKIVKVFYKTGSYQSLNKIIH